MNEQVEVKTVEGRKESATISRFQGFPDEGICGFRDEWQPGLLHAVSFHDSQPHHHEDMDEIFLVLQGSGKIVLGEVGIPVSRWDTVRVPPMVTHRGIPDEGQELIVAVFFVRNHEVKLDPEKEART
jgi:mannose-6-phosphate isomerase-like protein (cupin superfamily)